jgi:hypothetical protein
MISAAGKEYAESNQQGVLLDHQTLVSVSSM